MKKNNRKNKNAKNKEEVASIVENKSTQSSNVQQNKTSQQNKQPPQGVNTALPMHNASPPLGRKNAKRRRSQWRDTS